MIMKIYWIIKLNLRILYHWVCARYALLRGDCITAFERYQIIKILRTGCGEIIEQTIYRTKKGHRKNKIRKRLL